MADKQTKRGSKPKDTKSITIVMPQSASGPLVELTAYVSKKLGIEGGYGLGGENGYGVEYENETFMMHPFCWCEREDCAWCENNAPNFLFKPTGAKVWWYKWIGRSPEAEGELPDDWLNQCKESVNDLELKDD